MPINLLQNTVTDRVGSSACAAAPFWLTAGPRRRRAVPILGARRQGERSHTEHGSAQSMAARHGSETFADK
ncbi:MAG: hypothetical protein ACE5IY_12195 [bacterium]